MAAPTVIKSTDSDVPVLSGVAGSFIAILDFCLPQRGWQKLFSGTGKAVYIAQDGDRKCYRILNDDSLNYSSPCTHAKISAYDTMTDVDTGTGKWADDHYFALTVGGASPRPWVLVFDEKSVLFVSIPNKINSESLVNVFCLLHGFGETVPALQGIIPRSFVGGHSWDSPENNQCHLACPGRYNNNYGKKISCSRSRDGSLSGISVGQMLNGGFSGVDGAAHQPFGSGYAESYLPYPFNGDLVYGRPLLDDGVINTRASFGYDHVPFLHYPCHFRSAFQNLQPITDNNGDSFLPIYAIPLTTALSWSEQWNAAGGVILIKTT